MRDFRLFQGLMERIPAAEESGRFHDGWDYIKNEAFQGKRKDVKIGW
jgi:hypothetical protein